MVYILRIFNEYHIVHIRLFLLAKPRYYVIITVHQNVKGGIQIRVYTINKDSVTCFS